MPISPIPELAAELAAGRMVIVVDDNDNDRDDKGVLMMAADHVTPDAINFMAMHARGLVCLTLTRERCEQLRLPPMSARHGQREGAGFMVSIEAAHGIDTGISAADRAHTIRVAVARHTQPHEIVQPGHVFPMQAQDGGVLMRAGQAEAGCDLAHLAGCTPAAVVCEILDDDGNVARLPQLQAFAARHGLKIGTIADLIAQRSHAETLIEPLGQRALRTPWGEFQAHTFRDRTGQVHLALTVGRWSATDEVLVRVHEPLSVLDLLDADGSRHSWALPRALAALQAAGHGVAVLLNAAQDAQALLGQLQQAGTPPAATSVDLRTYGVGVQILRALGVRRMKLLSNRRRMPSMIGYGLEVTGFLCAEA